jgi:hypothetical protein
MFQGDADMKNKNTTFLIIVLAVIAILTTACTAIDSMPQQVKPADTFSQENIEPEVATSTAEPEIEVEISEPAKKGYVLFDPGKGEFFGYQMDHKLAFQVAAPGMNFPSPSTVEVVEGAVYYKRDQDNKIFRSSPQGLKEVGVPNEDLHAFSVSADEQWIAWSVANWGNNPAHSDLWVAKLDENLSAVDARKIATYSSEQSEAFNIVPLEWTSENVLLFDRFITGIGGYILFGGQNSLYTYDPATGQIATLIPAEEMHGLCLDGYRLDMDKVIFNCSKEGPGIVIRDLNDYTDTRIPAIAGYPASGSVHYSPSGKWLAYAAARMNYEDEAGLVLVVPADLSTAPTTIAEASDNRYANVLGWVDEDTILYSVNQWPESAIWSIKRDGSASKQISSGPMFAGWIR